MVVARFGWSANSPASHRVRFRPEAVTRSNQPALLNNLLCYFLGLIAFFAAHQPPTLGTMIHLAAALALGFSAATISTWIQARTAM